MSGFIQLSSVKTQEEINAETEMKNNIYWVKIMVKVVLVCLIGIPFCYVASVGYGIIELIFTQKTDVIDVCYRSFHFVCVFRGLLFWITLFCIGFLLFGFGYICVSGLKGIKRFGLYPNLSVPLVTSMVNIEEEGDEE
jgi:uncharacterized membrane protein